MNVASKAASSFVTSTSRTAACVLVSVLSHATKTDGSGSWSSYRRCAVTTVEWPLLLLPGNYFVGSLAELPSNLLYP